MIRGLPTVMAGVASPEGDQKRKRGRPRKVPFLAPALTSAPVHAAPGPPGLGGGRGKRRRKGSDDDGDYPEPKMRKSKYNVAGGTQVRRGGYVGDLPGEGTGGALGTPAAASGMSMASASSPAVPSGDNAQASEGEGANDATTGAAASQSSTDHAPTEYSLSQLMDMQLTPNS